MSQNTVNHRVNPSSSRQIRAFKTQKQAVFTDLPSPLSTYFCNRQLFLYPPVYTKIVNLLYKLFDVVCINPYTSASQNLRLQRCLSALMLEALHFQKFILEGTDPSKYQASMIYRFLFMPTSGHESYKSRFFRRLSNVLWESDS